ncbi:hypothetical protein MJI12_26215, partial [Salmonella enterica subsp. enterica serovar Kentucky]|nr:hypothetical protein [Salmonella enterica subsp. enterica serovar Kentucky]
AAGYVVYGSSTMLVYTTGYGVHAFTYDPSLGVFCLCQERMRFTRGVEKQKLSRQLFDHSTFMAPINMFMTRFSTLPAKQPYFDT